WTNAAQSSHDKVKISYYRYTDLMGSDQLLAFVVNISASPIESVTVSFPEDVTTAKDMLSSGCDGFTFPMDGYGCRILFVK
ncbi:MAG: hypothetical protein IJX93_03785, partial [Clostridia bacterium]|nr:hypothetical protein [Clostridia bacterium]